jgi:hypothetical protein
VVFILFPVAVAVAWLVYFYDRLREQINAGSLQEFEWVSSPTKQDELIVRPYVASRVSTNRGVQTRQPDAEYVLGYSGCAYTRYYVDEPFGDSLVNQYKVHLGYLLTGTRRCLYCGTPLRAGQTDDFRFAAIRAHLWRYETAECPVCHWWCVIHREECRELQGNFKTFTHAYAVMRQFDPLALDTPLSLAREYILHNPHKLARFDPFRFEDLIADGLKDYYGDAEIIKLGGRSDRGIDIKAVRTNGETTLIQVKRRADFSRREGVRVVRELHGVMLREGVPRGMVVSTASDFSRAARAEVAQARQNLCGYSMELLPLSDVVEILGSPAVQHEAPWRAQGIRIDLPEPDWPATNEVWIERQVLPDGLMQTIELLT